jgi:hypothetical protein
MFHKSDTSNFYFCLNFVKLGILLQNQRRNQGILLFQDIFKNPNNNLFAYSGQKLKSFNK